MAAYLRRDIIRALFVAVILIASRYALAQGPAQAANPLNQEVAISAPKEPLAVLGHKLFFDTRLSRDNSISCATCHRPDKAFSDGKPVAEGIGKQHGTRNTPSLLNAAYTQSKFWDGRRASLLEQVLDPYTNAKEHGLKDKVDLLERFKALADYANPYQTAFNKAQTKAEAKDLAEALAAFIVRLTPKQTRLANFLENNDKTAFDAAERHGLELFMGRAQCGQCHTVSKENTALTDGGYHARGVGLSLVTPKLAKLSKDLAAMPPNEREEQIGQDREIAALGRYAITLNPQDIGTFKTPSLHEVARTAPYMHDGSVNDLEAAMDWELYYQGQGGRPIVLSHLERNDLLAFLRALSGQDGDADTNHSGETP